jgi:hypothetical protein
MVQRDVFLTLQKRSCTVTPQKKRVKKGIFREINALLAILAECPDMNHQAMFF